MSLFWKVVLGALAVEAALGIGWILVACVVVVVATRRARRPSGLGRRGRHN